MATGNLFTKAKSTGTTKTTKAKDTKPRITVADPDFFTKVDRLSNLQDAMKRMKAESDIVSDEIKETAKDEWVRLFTETHKNPGSVILEAREGEDVATCMFVPSDKYITIDSDRAEALVETYGEDIVEEATTFQFDNAMIEKYGEVLSRLITESDEIEDRDKERIIKAVVKFSVAKGTIDKLDNYGDVAVVMEEVKPVVALKDVKIIKG